LDQANKLETTKTVEFVDPDNDESPLGNAGILKTLYLFSVVNQLLNKWIH